MKVLITGGGGFLGLRLARALLAEPRLELDGGVREISRLVLLDQVFPGNLPRDPRLLVEHGNLADPDTLAAVTAGELGAVFHLAAVVSAGAEADFDLGLRVNLDGTRALLEACRRAGTSPRFVFASSVAAFGGALPEVLDDATTPTPQSSYGAQKVIGEYLVADYSRRGFLDGRSLRLPTVVVRPGRPNAAASSFASAILREPLNGEIARCPVGPGTLVWQLSPRRVVEALRHACRLPAAAWPSSRVVNLPGITASVHEMLAALARVAGEATAARVRFEPEAGIEAIVRTWPGRFRTPRGLDLGFRADDSVDAIIRDYIEDEGIRSA